ncbi:ribonuclease III [Phocea massiliensis]|uniref:Mini-ribonuclease 3 n=1 Tax=Merdimmobilis hominis TaxID=2897707 RepID=A0A938X961_9FIRM|nr:ribonuclease III domain-containing protein [Merdimmobilis hominis]MBM6920944.1 ribonuclease III [Merdimmobilis hominis]
MEQLSSDAIRMMSPLGLAYIGDGIYELLTREHIVSRGNMPVAKFHKETVSLVCAAAQSEAVDVILPMLDEEETAVYKRGRNAHGSQVPKNADAVQYRRATGLEALFGYLYLNGRMERLHTLYEAIYNAACCA